MSLHLRKLILRGFGCHGNSERRGSIFRLKRSHFLDFLFAFHGFILTSISAGLSYRFRDGQVLDVDNTTKYDGATLDEPYLTILQVGPEDRGSYTCVLENEIGAGGSKNASTLDVICKR